MFHAARKHDAPNIREFGIVTEEWKSYTSASESPQAAKENFIWDAPGVVESDLSIFEIIPPIPFKTKRLRNGGFHIYTTKVPPRYLRECIEVAAPESTGVPAEVNSCSAVGAEPPEDSDALRIETLEGEKARLSARAERFEKSSVSLLQQLKTMQHQMDVISGEKESVERQHQELKAQLDWLKNRKYEEEEGQKGTLKIPLHAEVQSWLQKEALDITPSSQYRTQPCTYRIPIPVLRFTHDIL